LDIQRKIDAFSRQKKKVLKMAVDEVPDPDDAEKVLRVPAHKSKEALLFEYKQLGWWTDEDEAEMSELSSQHLALLTELELLNFKSEMELYQDVQEVRDRLVEHFKAQDDYAATLEQTIVEVTTLGLPMDPNKEATLRDAATSTEVDEIISSLFVLHRLFEVYKQLLETHATLLALQSEYAQLFNDSWQEQLQYYMRLAQVYYCTMFVETGKPLWSSITDLEKSKDTEHIRWAFAELSAFWQGLTEEVREKMNKYDFIFGRSVAPVPSDDSPVPPSSKQDGEPLTPTPELSTVATDTTES
jgi:hypothetical protein